MKILLAFFCVFLSFGFAQETRIFPENTPSLLESHDVQNTPRDTSMLPNAVRENTINIEDVNPKDFLGVPAGDLNFQAASRVKNVYLELLTPLAETLYVNQIIALEFKMLIFAQHSRIETAFIFQDPLLEDSVEVLNPEQDWVFNIEDSSFRNIVYFKIKQAQFAIPDVVVNVLTHEGLVEEMLLGNRGSAIKLERKGMYAQVLAQDLRLLETKITSYDSTQNLAVFQLQSIMGNLFDFTLEDYKQQGIESKSGDYKQAVAFYYVIVPKTLEMIRFDYFNTLTSKYQTLQVPNIASEDRVSTQSDIKPKNNYQFFKISLIAFFVCLFFGLYLYKRKIIFVLLAVLGLALLLYFLTSRSTVTIKANATLKIQPTFNSTNILTTQNPIRAEILGKRNQYYKVILDDERIGWVRKDDVKN